MMPVRSSNAESTGSRPSAGPAGGGRGGAPAIDLQIRYAAAEIKDYGTGGAWPDVPATALALWMRAVR